MGIGGAGMSALAHLLIQKGYQVNGCDMCSSPYLTKMVQRGVPIHMGHSEEHIRKDTVDLLVYSSAIAPTNPELLKAQSLGIPVARRAEILSMLFNEKHGVGVAGAHGKTTTTAMIIWVLRGLGDTPSYSIGSALSWGPSGYYNPDSQYFIYECDEFDRNFLKFHPDVSLITSIDYDHPDIYPTKEDYLQAFEDFSNQSGKVISWLDQHGEIFDERVNFINKVKPLFIPGEHNRRNATLVWRQLTDMGYDPGYVKTALESFPGVKRRFEEIENNIFSDYAHHPKEIQSTIELACEISDNVIVVYQPHQNARQHTIRSLYTDCFEGVKKIYWTPTYLTREDPNLEVLSPEQLTENITNKSIIEFTDLTDEFWAKVRSLQKDRNLIIFMGAGDIDEWLHAKIADDIAKGNIY